MAMSPARVKYRKMHRGSRKGLAHRGSTVAFGEYGLQSLERCWLDTKQIEAARVAVTRYMKRRGKVWIRIFPTNPSPKSRWRREWAKAKVRWNHGSLSFALPMFFLKSMGFQKSSRGNRCALRPPNCRSGPNSFPVTESVERIMKMTEIKDLTMPELSAKSRDFRQEIFNLRLQQASSQLEKPARLRLLRRDIARLETRITQLRNKPA